MKIPSRTYTIAELEKEKEKKVLPTQERKTPEEKPPTLPELAKRVKELQSLGLPKELIEDIIRHELGQRVHWILPGGAVPKHPEKWTWREMD